MAIFCYKNAFVKMKLLISYFNCILTKTFDNVSFTVSGCLNSRNGKNNKTAIYKKMLPLISALYNIF